jgi:hypothetical protein
LTGGAKKHGPYTKDMSYCEPINHDQVSFESYPGQDHSDPNHGKPELTMYPHPLSDFSHVDPIGAPGSLPDANRPDFPALRSRIKLRTSGDAQRIAELDYLQRLNQAVGPESDAFQRLRRCFDLLVCRAYKLLGDINNAVKAGCAKDYAAARDAYREFVANLDDREPHFKRGGVDVKKRLGYGKNIQWVFIDPVIQRVPNRLVLITGARIIIKWNPHSSSSGVPVPH